jgi:lysophospholipase L1-like esterase
MHDSLEYSIKKNPSTIRIIGIGDSGMFGWGVEQFENYLAVLEKNLTDKHGKDTYEVLNFAVPGYNTQQEIELLKSKGLSYQPDIVILGWCENDFNAPFFVYRKKEYRQLKKSYLYSYLFYRKGKVIQPEIMKVSELDSEFINPEIIEYTGLEGVKKSLLKLKQLGEEFKFKIVVFGAMKPDILAICKEVNLDYYNILEKIPYGTYPREYEVYYMHPRAEGHRVLAEHLEKKLKTKGWLKEKSSKQ